MRSRHARTSEEAARLQITRMMDEQLVQSQTIEGLRRQVESSNTSAQQAQALLHANQEQQSWIPPPNTSSSSGAGGAIGSTPLIQPLSTPSTGFRTRELHGSGYYHIGSPADQGYAEHMRAMFGRDDMDPPRQEPPRQEQQLMGSFSRGSGSQYTNPSVGWHVRAGQGVPAFPGSRIVPTRRVDPRDASMQRMLKFGSAKVPKLSKANLVNTEVHLLIQYIRIEDGIKLEDGSSPYTSLKI